MRAGTKTVNKFPTADMFAAAAAAHRVNGGEYVKKDAGVLVDGSFQPHPKPSNRGLMEDILGEDCARVTDSDRQLAEEILTHFRGLTLKVLTGKPLNEFEHKALQLATSDQIDIRDIGVAACLPSCYCRALGHKKTNNRLLECKPEWVGRVGEKIHLGCDVVKCVFSQKWSTYYLTCITKSNHSVFFPHKVDVAPGTNLTITGKVKFHRDGFVTQLSHIKVI